MFQSNLAESTPLPEVSIVIPCLNEEKTIQLCIDKAKSALAINGVFGEIIIADNGSTDRSIEIATIAGARVVHVTKKGYGAALDGGIRAAQGEYVIMGDGDDSYDFGQIMPFIEKLKKGEDLVMGCRFPRGGGRIMPGAMPWKHRWIGNPVLSGIGKLLFKSPIRDFHCGIRGFRRSIYEKLELQTLGMEFASEMIVKATVKGFKLSEIPVTLYKDGRERPPHLRSWRDGWRHLRFMLLYSPRWLFLLPGLFLTLCGLIFGTILLQGPIKIGEVFFDTNTLLVCAMLVLVGFTLMSFAVFTRIFSTIVGLLPPSPSLNFFLKYITLESGLVIGSVILLSGTTLFLHGFLDWKESHFGPLLYPKTLRVIIPAVTFMVLGTQVIFSSFFLSILGLKLKNTFVD